MMNLLPSPAALRRLIPGLVLLAAVLLLLRDTAVAMVGIWERSDTFAHAFLVPPIVIWMIWRRGPILATMPVRAAPWVLLPMAATGLLWLLSELASVNAGTQFALVALIVLSVPLVYGLAITQALMFPLMFLFFSVPVGEFLVPVMMDRTADFTVAALQWSGVPVYREGLQFVIPSGNWSVVEACSGVRYLIASFMVGTLFAYLNYSSTKKRVIFIVASILLPILANWFRAYLIVMLGHLSGNKLAAGVDHIIYCWVFFGIVIGIMFMVGARWADPLESAPAVQGKASAAAAVAADRSPWVMAAAGMVLLALVVGAAWQINRPRGGDAPRLALPEAGAGGWQRVDQPLTSWVTNFNHANAKVAQTYSLGDQQVGVRVFYYRDQNYERKLVTSSNTLTEGTVAARWAQIDAGRTSLPIPGGDLALRTAVLRSVTNSAQSERLRVWQIYWVGGRFFASDARAKLHGAVDRLMGHGDDAAALFFYTPLGASAEAADATLSGFVKANLAGLTQTLQAARAAN